MDPHVRIIAEAKELGTGDIQHTQWLRPLLGDI
jgi:hypothetical protein